MKPLLLAAAVEEGYCHVLKGETFVWGGEHLLPWLSAERGKATLPTRTRQKRRFMHSTW